MVFGTKQARAKAQKHHKGRSKRARAADEGKQAKRVLTATFKNIEKWMKNPGRYDIKLIDTKKKGIGKKKRKGKTHKGNSKYRKALKETKKKYGELRPI